jgi:hypothetical protein
MAKTTNNSNNKGKYHHSAFDISQSIRDAIAQGAPLYNNHNQKGCYQIYLATAYKVLSQETLHEVMGHELHTDHESQKIIELVTKSTGDARVLILKTKEYNEGAWILRRAFDEILKLQAAKKEETQKTTTKQEEEDSGTEEELRTQGVGLANLVSTIEEVVEIKNRKYRLKAFEKCFVGKEAVSKLVDSHVFMSRTSAVAQLQQLLEIGLLEHVTKEHAFEDTEFFYRLASTTEINVKLKPFRTKSQFLKGKNLIHYTALLGRYKQFHKHPSLGVIRLDYDYPPSPGDIDSPDSYTYPVYYRAVPGLSFEMCQSGKLTPEVAKAFDRAVIWLAEHRDVSTITGDCGFMMWFIERSRSLCTKKPILLSALMQLPTMIAACADEDKIIVMTANGQSLLPMMDLIVQQCGIHSKMEQIVIIGCEDVPYFGEPVAKGLMVDVEKAQPGIVAKVKDAIRENPSARMVLMECTELPPYSDAVREATRLPVYDSITQSDFSMNGFLDNSAFGLNGWYESWDGVQEEYVLGGNLDASEKLQCVWCANKEHNHKF